MVHHANQYLITDGYDNREGLSAVIGEPNSGSGIAHVLSLHEKYQVPFNLHLSGTLLEAIAWHHPEFLDYVKRILKTGLIELVGSCYGQNIMRFFGEEYNRKQLNEELHLYRSLLEVDVTRMRAFWPPERVWETERIAPVLRDARLHNNGYQYVIVDDRLLARSSDPLTSRAKFDSGEVCGPEFMRVHAITSGLGLVAVPINTSARRAIPPRNDEDWKTLEQQLRSSQEHQSSTGEALLNVYADDMEKVAGIGEWGGDGAKYYEEFLQWLKANSWLHPVQLTPWAQDNVASGERSIETGTFEELAKQFDAGEGYDNWFHAEDWEPYRRYFTFADEQVQRAAAEGADPKLLALAEKQLLVGNWETAWHTPASGPHGDPELNGHASPWAKALTSHVRLAGVSASAATWSACANSRVHLDVVDIDNDGEREIVLKNAHVYAVLSPRWGARLVSLYRLHREGGAMVIGNPCDDWNWMEELNKFMEVPRNHPGCFADIGYENDRYSIMTQSCSGQTASITLLNTENGSRLRGTTKTFVLNQSDEGLECRYDAAISGLEVEYGLSPDYLHLLRCGSRDLRPLAGDRRRGAASGVASVWIELADSGDVAWAGDGCEQFGHGCRFSTRASAKAFSVRVMAGPGDLVDLEQTNTAEVHA